MATAVSKASGDEPPNGGVQMWCGAEDYLGAWRDMPAVLAAMPTAVLVAMAKGSNWLWQTCEKARAAWHTYA